MATQDEFKDSEEGKELAPEETQVSEEEQEEKETPKDDTSTEEKPESEESEEKSEDVEKAESQGKGLDNEIAKLESGNEERRNRIVQLRNERRTQKDELGDNQRGVGDQQPTEQPKTTDYDNSANYVIGEFVKEHPEYSTESDSGDSKWAELFRESELEQNRPPNPFDVKKRLEKAHAYIQSQNPNPKSDPDKENAEKEKLKLAGQGGGNSGGGVTGKKYSSSDLKIFTDMGYSREEAIPMAISKRAR